MSQEMTGFWEAATSAGPYMQTICTLLQTDNHTNTLSLNFTGGCSSWRSTNGVKAVKAQ